MLKLGLRAPHTRHANVVLLSLQLSFCQGALYSYHAEC